MLAPTCSTMISSDEPRCRGFNQSRMQFPLSIDMLLARDSIIGIPIPRSISLPASHFTHSVMHDPLTKHLVTLSSLWWCITEWARDTSPSYGVTNPSLDSCQPNRYFRRYLYCTFIVTSYVVTFGTPKALLRYQGVTQSHGLSKWYLTLEKL